jgi:hypothetical protein
MQKVAVLIILLILSGCMGSHVGMGHGNSESSGGSHQH